MARSGRGWDDSMDALPRRVYARAREAAFARGHRPVRKAGAWEMATYAGPPAAGTEPAGPPAAGTESARSEPRSGDGPAGEPGVSPSGWRRGPGMGDVGSGPGPSRRDPQTLGGLTSRVLAEHGWTRPVAVAGVVSRWPEIVGPAVADHCVVESFTDGDLVVRADSTAWATQLRLLLPQIERRLTEEVGEGAVTTIDVRGPGGPTWKHGRWKVHGGRGPRDTYG